MNKKTLMIVVPALIAFMINPAFAEKMLSADEAKALFSDKTFDGYNEKKGKSFRVYSSPDGKHIVKKGNGKTKEKQWRINDQGQHCVKGGREKCTNVFDMGSGVYHKKKSNGKHTHTLKNFVDGNQL